MDWRVYLQWMYCLSPTIPEGPLVAVRIYGHVAFVGSGGGMLNIYYSPCIGGEFDIFNLKPVKQYNFICPIIQIDVMEGEAGHTVIVAMQKKIAVLEFTHNFKRTASVEILPYNDVQEVKVLKIEESQ